MSEATATLNAGYGSTAVARYSGILEVNAADLNQLNTWLKGKQRPSIPDLLADSVFNGNPVLHTELPEIPDDPCIVPHFGHSINCDPGTCDGPNVYRLFGTTLYLATTGKEDAFGRYELTENAQIDICGRKQLSPGTTPRNPVTSDA